MLLARTILILLTAVLCVIVFGPLGHADYAGRWGEGTYGIAGSRVTPAIVTEVEPESPAALAGVREGDFIVADNIVLPTRVRYPFAGERRTVTFDRPGGSRYTVNLVATTVPNFGTWDRITEYLATIPTAVFIAVAFVLVFLRPNVMTWSFFFYAIGYASTGPSYQYFLHVMPQSAFEAMTFFNNTVLGTFAVLPLIPFLLRFPDGKLNDTTRKIDRVWWVVMALGLVAYTYEWYGYAHWQSGITSPAFSLIDVWLPLATFALAGFALLKKVKHAPPEMRQRFGFLTIGLSISFIAYAIYFVPGVPFYVTQLVGYAVVVMPITVAYAVFRHRVLDVNFVLNRALAYGLLSIVVIALVSLLDWTFSRLVSEQHLAVVVELGVTICVGFLLDRINKFIEMIVERVFFRSRRAAEKYIKKVAAALPYATEEQAVSEGLTQAPGDALRLVAAALYRRSNDGTRFDGIATSLQTPVAPPGFEVNHLLVRMLQSSEQRVWLEEVRNYLDADNSSKYVIAIPITVRHELVSFALYGAHTNGAQLDPDEIELLEDLAREASRAYDHIEAVRVREQYASFMTQAAPGIA